MPASRTSAVTLVLLRVRKDLKKPRGPLELSLVNGGGDIGPFSSSGSSERDNTRRMSEQLWMVVEQLICPPK